MSACQPASPGERVGAYLRRDVRGDFVAALNVAVVALPQSMAYAIIAGVPPIYGLYTSIVSTIVGALAGSSRRLITGPTNATALMFMITLGAFVGGDAPLETVFLFTALIGAIKLAMGLLRFGQLVHYISDAVIIGFTAGAGILIAGNQLKHFLGVPGGEGLSFMAGVVGALADIGATNPFAVGTAVATAAAILAMDKWLPKVPSAFVVTIAAGAVAWVLGYDERGVVLVRDLGEMARSLPSFQLPDFGAAPIGGMMSGAAAVAVIGLMEATAVSKAIAVSSGQKIDSNREFIGQGLANLVGACFQNFVSSGSFIRSALNYQSGAKTRLAAVMSGVLVAVAVLTVGPLAMWIPVSSLAGLLMIVAVRMVRFERLRACWLSGKDSAIILVVTIGATLTIRLDWAIYLGVATALFFYIKDSSATRMSLFLPTKTGRFREVDIGEAGREDIEGQHAIINVVGSLYFGALDDYDTELRQVIAWKPRTVIIRLRRIISVDSSAIASLDRLNEYLADRDIPLILTGVDEPLMETFQRTGLVERFGPDRVVASRNVLFSSMQATLQKADDLAPHPDEKKRADQPDPIEWVI